MKIKNSKKMFTAAFLMCSAFFVMNAQEEKEFTINVIPVVEFSMLQIEDSNFIYSPSATLQFVRTKNENSNSRGPDKIAGYASYAQDIIEKMQFHSMGAFGKVVTEKNSFLGKIDIRGAKPFESYKNLEGVLMYGRELVKNDSVTFTVGGGIAATNTGIKIGEIDLFVIPMPMLYFAYSGKIISSEIEWIGLPSVRFVLLPEKMFRLQGSCSLAGLDLPSDLRFDCALCCYPVANGFLKDLFYISAGISNNINKFRIDLKNSIKYQYYCAYGEISITALTIRAGYAFGGKQTFTVNEEKYSSKYNGGIFAAIQGMYKF